MDIRKEIFEYSNTHLIETDKKRDQAIAAYILIVGLYLGFLDDFNSLGNSPKLSAELTQYDYISISMFLLSLVFIAIIINYRRWHNLYVHSVVVASVLMVRDLPFSTENIEKIWKEKFESGKYRELNPSKLSSIFFSYLGSTEVQIYNAFSVISFPTVYLVFEAFISINSITPVTQYIVYQLIYTLILNIFAYRILRNVDRHGYKISWLLKYT
jgi:hypothetical protein